METTNTPISDLFIIDTFKTAFALSQTELSVNHIQRLDDKLFGLEIPEATARVQPPTCCNANTESILPNRQR
jgi:hypothetical protein